MPRPTICLSDSEESARNDDDNDDMDFNFPSVDFHYLDVNEARDANEEVNGRIDRAGSRSNEPGSTMLLERATVRVDDVVSTDNGKKSNISPVTFNNKDGKLSSAASRTNTKNSGEKSTKVRAARDESDEWSNLLRVRIDRDLAKFDFTSSLLDVLRESDISYELETLPIANSIAWIRKIENVNENEIAIVWNWDETVKKVEDGSFTSSIESIATSLTPNKKIILLLYGMDEYFRLSRKSTKRDRTNVNNMPKITKRDLEICLAEIQLSVGCNGKLVDNERELGMLVRRLTKGIAEKPFKLEKRQRLEENIDWYATGDNRDTARVDKNGTGLKRLWQQQLRQFNLASLETAEAISTVYPSPFSLIQAYENCTSSEGERLLSEIPIRRAAGPLSTIRKIGMELSKKMYITFTSKDGNTTLGNDREP